MGTPRWWLAVGVALALVTACGGEDGGGRGDGETVGAGNPCKLASAAEVTQVVGTAVERAPASGAGTFGGVRTRSCNYQAQTADGLLTVGVQTVGFGEPGDVRQAFSRVGEVEDAGIDGLPASTFATEVSGLRTVWVVDAETPFGVHVAVAAGSEFTDRPEDTEELARSLYQPT